MLLMPLTTYCLIPAQTGAESVPPQSADENPAKGPYPMQPPASQRLAGNSRGFPSGQIGQEAPAAVMPSSPAAVLETPLRLVLDGVTRSLAPLVPWAAVLWAVGVVGLSLRHLGGYLVVRRLSRRGVMAVPESLDRRFRELKARLGVTRPVRLLQSILVDVPMAMGWLRPVILAPASALTGLGPDALEAVLAHELAHIRRCDYLVNLLQTAVETLLFYHPAAWWLSARIRTEREQCCDDAAVAACGSKVEYAEALTTLEKGRRLPELAMAASGGRAAGATLRRVRRILGVSSPDRSPAGLWLGGIIALALLASLAVVVPLGHAQGEQKPLDLSHTTARNDAGQSLVRVSDETLSACLRHAELVVAGEIASKPTAAASGKAGLLLQWRFDFKISDVLKGTKPGEGAVPVIIDRAGGSAERPEFVQGDRLVLFLVRANKWIGEKRPWFGAYLGADAQPASPDLIAKVKRLVATTLPPASGAVQLDGLVNKYLEGFWVGKDGILRTPARKEIDLKAAQGQWRGTTISLPPASSHRDLVAEGLILWRNPALDRAVPSLNLKVPTAAAAEDVARMILGLFKGPGLLEDWTVKAQPMENGWLVTPTYDGPPAQVGWQGPVELIVEDGLLKDVRQRGSMLASMFPAHQAGGPHPAGNVAESGWGKPVDGLAVRLQSDKPVWYFAEPLALRLSVRNLGSETLAVPESEELGELEMDGVWFTFSYQGSKPYYVVRKPLAPGRQVDDIAVLPTADWSKGATPLRAVAGKHTIRFAVSAVRKGPGPGPTIRAVSNPVEVEFRWGVSPRPSGPPTANPPAAPAAAPGHLGFAPE